MLEKPDLEDEALTAHLQGAYTLPIVRAEFLPLGADPDTAVYRAVAADGTPYFVKLRRGVFDEASVTLPRYLSEHGVEHIIAPLPAKNGQLWTTLSAFTVILYPFVAGKSGYEVPLTKENWRALGSTLRRLHTLNVPPPLLRRVRREGFEANGRDKVKAFLSRLEPTAFADDTARETAAFMQARRADLVGLVRHAERFARTLQGRALEWVVCHADLHAGNLLLDGTGFYIVDWDDPILAPKERDLMFIGGGQGFAGYTPAEEARLFYEGYGQVQVDPIVLAYYRFERIVQDVAVYCDELTHHSRSSEDREQSLRYLKANFVPGGTVERAYAANATLAEG